MDIPKIKKHLTTKWLGLTIHFELTLDSTNAWASRALAQGAKRGDVFLADYQTNGRGRKNRTWESFACDNILLSLIDIPPSNPRLIHQLTLIAGIAFLEGIKNLFPSLNLKCKWPNDLFLDDKKLAGILCEKKQNHVLVGVGMNVNATLDSFSKETQKTATSLLCHLGHKQNREDIIASCLNSYETWREQYDLLGFSPIQEAWEKYSLLSGKTVCILEDSKHEEGIALGLDFEGYLLVNVKGDVRRVIAGDVVLL